MLIASFALIAAIATAVFWIARLRAADHWAKHGPTHSRPYYHGAYAAAWAAIPAAVMAVIWTLLQDTVINWLILESLPGSITDGKSSGELNLTLSEIRQIAAGRVFGVPSPELSAAAERLSRWQSIADMALVATAAGIVVAASAIALARLKPNFRARNRFENILSGLMIFSSLVAILTTLGIISALLFEARSFFAHVPPTEFLFGLRWEPQIAIRADQVAGSGAFGAIPVFSGTLLIAAVAMAIATPIGLLSSIYLSEYAHKGVRASVKPALEILAGVPTVVYGFFAVLVVAPSLVRFGDAVGLDVAPNSAIAAGSVMGIMIIPFISSLSDDALNAVPNSLREGAYALGATKGETVSRVLIPAALPGIVGGILLAVSRAIGETMIVVMAAGLIARLTANPFEGVTTVTVQIVSLLTGDTEFDNPKTLAAFALGLVLFLVTLVLNIIALRIVKKYREQYE